MIRIPAIPTGRYDVSAAVAAFAFTDPAASGAFIANGAVFADALSAGPAALEMFDGPVLLTDGASPRIVQTLVVTIEALDLSLSRIAGGTASVSSGIEADLRVLADEPEGVVVLGGTNTLGKGVSDLTPCG